MGILEDDDIVYFATLNDMWLYGGLSERSSGYRIYLEYEPRYNYNVQNYKEKQEIFPQNYITEFHLRYKTNDFINYIRMAYLLERPFKQKYQSSFFGSIGYGFINHNYESESLIPPSNPFENGNKEKEAIVALTYSFGFYPNTRSDFRIGTNLNGHKNWYKAEDVISEYEYYFYGANLFTNMNYYFSPNLQLKFR